MFQATQVIGRGRVRKLPRSKTAGEIKSSSSKADINNNQAKMGVSKEAPQRQRKKMLPLRKQRSFSVDHEVKTVLVTRCRSDSEVKFGPRNNSFGKNMLTADDSSKLATIDGSPTLSKERLLLQKLKKSHSFDSPGSVRKEQPENKSITGKNEEKLNQSQGWNQSHIDPKGQQFAEGKSRSVDVTLDVTNKSKNHEGLNRSSGLVKSHSVDFKSNFEVMSITKRFRNEPDSSIMKDVSNQDIEEDEGKQDLEKIKDDSSPTNELFIIKENNSASQITSKLDHFDPRDLIIPLHCCGYLVNTEKNLCCKLSITKLEKEQIPFQDKNDNVETEVIADPEEYEELFSCDEQTCRASGKGLRQATVGEPSEFYISTGPGHSDSLNISVSFSGFCIPDAELMCIQNNNYLLTYWPERVGNYVIEVNWKGKRARGSPFHVKALLPKSNIWVRRY